VALCSARIGFESIKFSEIEAWLNLNGIFNLERRQEITHLIRIMDQKYLEYLLEERERNSKIRK